jgi:hypothetical protein
MSSARQADERFMKFGTVSFTGISKINDFIGHLEDGRITGTRCGDCGRAFFPPRADCCHCRTSHMQWFDVGGTGRLVTYSRLAFAPVGFQDDVPYCIALLDYGEYKVFGRIAADLPEEDIKIGMEMVATVSTLPDGRLTYEFAKR